MSEPVSPPTSPGGFVGGFTAAPTVVLLGAKECLLAWREGQLKCVRGDHDHVGESE